MTARAVLIVVHGSGRNSENYLSSAHAASHIWSGLCRWCCPNDDDNGNGNGGGTAPRSYNSSVLIVAPRSLAPKDGPILTLIPYRPGAEPLCCNKTYPTPHTWRYGAEYFPVASSLSSSYSYLYSNATVRSFEAMDWLVEHFVIDCDRRGSRQYPFLDRVVVEGHYGESEGLRGGGGGLDRSGGEIRRGRDAYQQ